MALSANERAARYRARKKGEAVPTLKPGPKRGYKQSKEHIEKRKRFGEEHHSWAGRDANKKTGRTRAQRKYSKRSCEICGETKKRIDRHHIDGDTLNNEESNIRFLCRKCHMQEDGRLGKFVDLAKSNQPRAVASRWN